MSATSVVCGPAPALVDTLATELQSRLTVHCVELGAAAADISASQDQLSKQLDRLNAGLDVLLSLPHLRLHPNTPAQLTRVRAKAQALRDKLTAVEARLARVQAALGPKQCHL